MSYILDALQRADAERERGTVPGLHAQPLGAPERRRDGHSQMNILDSCAGSLHRCCTARWLVVWAGQHAGAGGNNDACCPRRCPATGTIRTRQRGVCSSDADTACC